MPEIGTQWLDVAGHGNVVTAAGLRPGAKATDKPPEPKDWRARPRPYPLPVSAENPVGPERRKANVSPGLANGRPTDRISAFRGRKRRWKRPEFPR